jgi:hypothetical protein
VANPVETAFDIAFQNPQRVRALQCTKALSDRIGAGPLLTEPIRVFISGGFRAGSSASKYKACIARSFMVGIPSGRIVLPSDFGM